MKIILKKINPNIILLILCVFPLIWPLFNYDWVSVDEILISKRQLTTFLSKSANFYNLEKYCPLMVINLDKDFIDSYPFDKNFSHYQISELYWIQSGGKYSPKNCLSRNKVAILIPFKNHHYQLNILVPYLHSFISQQLVEYRIFVITSIDNDFCNKGILYNSGFIEINKLDNFNCFIFHNVDFLPENQFNLYSCSNVPRHLSVKLNNQRYILPNRKLIDGVFSILTKHYKKINGFSNDYYGWDDKDSNFYKRISFYNLSILRTPDIGTYSIIPFRKSKNDNLHRKSLQNSINNLNSDGLSDIKYKLIHIEEKLLYTLIKINCQLK